MSSKVTGYDSAYVTAAQKWEASIANAERRRQLIFATQSHPLSPTPTNDDSSDPQNICNRLGDIRISFKSNSSPGMANRLGLGSRANSVKRPTEQRSLRQPVPFATSISANTTPRRGFGLFEDDLEDEDASVEMQDPAVPVKFSGDTSGFTALRNYKAESSGDEMTPRRAGGSRKSQHSTPSRPKSARPNRRQTPYNSTTSRALQRARRVSVSERDDDRLIFESLEQETTSNDGIRTRQTKKKAQFVMSRVAVGASGDDELQENEPLLGKKNPTTPEGQNKTWGQWLKSILPKPLATVLKPRDSLPRTPEQAEQALLEIPGSYDRVSANEPTPVRSYSPLVKTLIPNPNGLFSYPADADSPPAQTPNNHRRRLTYTPYKGSPGRPISVSPAPALRNPSNFIERMRTSRGTRRYDPYSRPSRSVTPQRSPEKATEQMTPQEQLEMLERRKRDRKVQEAEDRYLKRAAVRALGQNFSSSEDEVDEGVQTSPVKSSRRYDEDQEMASTTPPSTPPKTPSFSFSAPSPPKFEPSSAPLFNDIESDKENAPSTQPPPPPSPSHRQLPDIHNTTPPPPVPPGVGLFEPVNRQRAVLEKHKPRVSSSLRNEATQQKENAVASSSSSSTMTGGLFGKAVGEKQLVPAPSTSASSSSSMGGLREVESNQLLGQGVKVDVRAKIAALPVKDLAALISWPALEIPGSKDIREKVTGCWSAEEPAAREVARAVTV